MVPTFTVDRSTGSVPSYAPAARHGYAAGLHRGLPADDFNRPRSSPPPNSDGCAPQPSPDPPDSSWWVVLRGVQSLVPHVHLSVSLAGPGPSGSTGPSRRCRGCFPPSPASQDQAAPSFTSPLRRAGREVFHPRTVTERLVAHEIKCPHMIWALSSQPVTWHRGVPAALAFAPLGGHPQAFLAPQPLGALAVNRPALLEQMLMSLAIPPARPLARERSQLALATPRRPGRPAAHDAGSSEADRHTGRPAAPRDRDGPEASGPLGVDATGSEFPLGDLLQRRHLEHLIGNDPLQLGVLDL